MPNRLSEALSPYLHQHADNPVDWYEWGEEAFAEARQRDVPVLVSIGYAACHWCHVMAHESFEDDDTAAYLNQHFVSIKVDREERPDVDALYMQATVAMNGNGGWPMTVFTDALGRPFHAGTYYPPTPRAGMPSFRMLLQAIHHAWTTQREDVTQSGRALTQALHDLQSRSAASAGSIPTEDDLAAAVRRLAEEEDQRHGGFGIAPKFPPAMVCEFLLRHAATHTDAAPTAGELAGRTLGAMARSGMYDQLAGGFARYAVDRAWVVPHFEKMLYDNAQLARVYLHWWRSTGDPTGLRIALETCEFMVRDLGTAEGGIASSLDADSPAAEGFPGGEGATYVWTPEQLLAALGTQDGEWAAGLLGVTEEGTFEDGASTLQLTWDVCSGEDAGRWQELRERLAAARAIRPQPARDDKVVAAWNGMAIAALAETGWLAERPDLLDAAAGIAELLLTGHRAGDGGLLRVSRAGRAGSSPALLEDYAGVAEGLFALFSATGEKRWYSAALELVDAALERFVDDGGRSVRDSQADPLLGELGNASDATDNATPSGRSALGQVLLTAWALSGTDRYHATAEQLLAVSGDALGSPRFHGWALAALQALLDGPSQVAVVVPESPADTQAADLHRTAGMSARPGLVVAKGRPDDPDLPVLADRPCQQDRPTAYLCRGSVCSAPTTDPEELALELAR